MMNKVAIIDGCRTPFAKAAGVLARYSTLDLGSHVVAALVERMKIDPNLINELIFSTVMIDPRTSNLAREIILRSKLPKSINSHFISNNCISGLVAATFAADGIRSGRINCAFVGGAESISRPTLTWHPKAESFFLKLNRARSFTEKLALLTQFRLKYLAPQAPSPKEPSTGLTMGQHCEITTKEMGIPRNVQDTIAFNSHKNAASAQERGYLTEVIAALPELDKDNLIRKDTSLEKLAKLSPVFDRSSTGTITAGNASALTDGASVVCLMSEAEANRQNREIKAVVRDTTFAAVSPGDGLLMAPVLALPELLRRNNLKVSDIDLFEVHEAFGAQVAANLEGWEKGWQRYPELNPLGTIPREKINVNGGSIAIGHPFAATGGRLLLSTANELKRRSAKRAVISVCAAGAMAAAVLIER
jgi:acetyl-CoA acetyltransferase family protein